MKSIVFGATGMVGQGVLRECLLDPARHGSSRRVLDQADINAVPLDRPA
jgi:hypothetical protein